MKHYIALADADCFFVSAERAYNPKLNNIPVAVLSNNDGCVVSRSKEAKFLGLKMGEPYFMAGPRLPQILYVRANHDLYADTSKKVMTMLSNYTPNIEVCSIDEAYLDLTGLKTMYKKNYYQIIQMMRTDVLKKLNIPLSIGLSSTKTLAKLASDKAKNTDGLYLIGSAKCPKIFAQTKIEDVSGIGHKILQKMRENCIFTIADFIARPDHFIKAEFGTHGTDIKQELLGTSLFKVCPKHKSPLSIQQTSALKEFTDKLPILQTELIKHIHQACQKARKENAKAVGCEVMLRTKNFELITLKEKFSQPTNEETIIVPSALKLLNLLYSPTKIWRSTGITLTPLTYQQNEQLDLFNSKNSTPKKLGATIDALEKKFGKNIITFGIK